MGERKLEAFLEQLLDVWSTDVGGLLNLDDLEDLQAQVNECGAQDHGQFNVRGST